jgi:hypothetical protein
MRVHGRGKRQSGEVSSACRPRGRTSAPCAAASPEEVLENRIPRRRRQSSSERDPPTATNILRLRRQLAEREVRWVRRHGKIRLARPRGVRPASAGRISGAGPAAADDVGTAPCGDSECPQAVRTRRPIAGRAALNVDFDPDASRERVHRHTDLDSATPCGRHRLEKARRQGRRRFLSRRAGTGSTALAQPTEALPAKAALGRSRATPMGPSRPTTPSGAPLPTA